MNEIISEIFSQMQNKEDSMLITIVESAGSSPRGTGSQMLVGKNGIIAGTIGGGMVEHRSIELGCELLEKKESYLKKFLLKPNQIEDLGMICGGEVEVMFHYISWDDQEMQQILQLVLESLEKHQESWLIEKLENRKMSVGFHNENLSKEGLAIAKRYQTNSYTFVAEGNDGYFIQPIKTKDRVFIFGGGHVAQALVKILTALDFYTIVYEDREEFLLPELLPMADERILGSFEDIYANIAIEKKDYAVVMTRGHKADFALEVQLLNSPAYYIGVIGSKRKVGTHKNELKKLGKTSKEIARLTMPIGLEIGAETPAEIAISVAAQLIQKRAERG